MKTIQLTKKDVHQGHLLLVNRQHAIHSNYEQKTKTLLAVDHNRDIYLDSYAGTMLSQLLKACHGENEILPISGYRSLQEQQHIFDTSMSENGEEFTRNYVAFPGCSEHQTGLAVDVAKQSEEIAFLCPDFPYSGICQQFRTKAADFGFIERYQKGKEQITGISHEPWHFRYVGHPHARFIEKNNLTLEEYIQLLKSHRHERNPLLFQENGETIEVSFVELTEDQKLSVRLPDGLCQISGNNVDGVIATIWRRSS